MFSPSGRKVLVLFGGVFAGSLFAYRTFERQTRRIQSESGPVHRPRYVEQTGAFSPPIRESSGVAASRSQPGVLWTHNDSGDTSRVYATTLSGREVGRYFVRGASARDWEDIALGPCPNHQPERSCLYIAETGNNKRRHHTLYIYVVEEPAVDTTAAGSDSLDIVLKIAFDYPDEPHDSEALGVTPDGELLVVTKGRTGTINMYRVVAGATEAEFVATLPIEPRALHGRRVTGAAVSPDGRTMVVRTYTELYFLDMAPGQPPVLTDRVCSVGALARTGEAVDFFDDSTLVLTGETMGRVPGPIHLVRCD